MNNDALPPSSRNSSAYDELLTSSTAGVETESKLRKRIIIEKRAELLDHLLLNLDIIIYLQFSILYYMNPSLFVLLARLIPQWIYLTPKSPLLPPLPMTSRPYILVFFIFNFLYVFMDLMFEPAAAGQATRGYLHGGVIVDFVGQLSPVSRVRLVATQLLVWALQVIMLGISLERRKLAGRSDETAAAGASRGITDEGTASLEDYDAAERGERGAGDTSDGEDIELQPLDRGSDGSVGSENYFPFSDTGSACIERHPLDSFNSGQHVIAHIGLVNMVRMQWSQRNTFSSASSQANPARSGSAAAVAAIAAGRNLGFRLRTGAQPLVT